MKSKIYFLLVLLCCSVAVAYIWCFAKDRFVSYSRFSIVVEDTSNVDVSAGLLSLIANGSRSNADIQSAIGYIHSADMLLEIEKEFDLSEHFTAPDDDPVFRLERDPSLEDRLKYYRKRIIAKFNATTGFIDLSVESFDPDLTYRISQSILARTEQFVNELNKNIATKRMEFVKQELDRSLSVVNEEQKKLLNFQSKHGIIDPNQIINARYKAIESLNLEVIKREAELGTLRATSPKSPLIKSLATTLEKLKEEIVSQHEKLTGADHKKLSQILAEYKELELKWSFAVKLKEGAQTLVEKTRAEAISNSRFFTVIQSPYFAEEQTNPRRWYLSFTIIVLIMISFYILRALVSSICDRI